MLTTIVKWHQTVSWKLGYRHGIEGRPYDRPWWANEALYALAFTYATRIEKRTVGTTHHRPIDQNAALLKRAVD
jgi:hypothetical protein